MIPIVERARDLLVWYARRLKMDMRQVDDPRMGGEPLKECVDKLAETQSVIDSINQALVPTTEFEKSPLPRNGDSETTRKAWQ